MRTQLLCALVILGGAGAAHAQQWPAYAQNGYLQGYGSNYPGAAPAYNYYGYPQQGAAYYPPAQNYPGYAYPPNYNNGYANNPNTNGYYGSYANSSPYTSATPTPQPGPSASANSSDLTPAAPPPQSADPILPPLPAQTETAPPAPTMGAMPLADLATQDPLGCAPGGACPTPAPPVPALPPVAPAQSCFWVSAEYMMAWIKSQQLSTPLATLGSPTDAHPGALGQPGTVPLFGQTIDSQTFSGIHADVGMFVDPDRRFAVDVGGFYLFPNHTTYSAGSDSAGNPIIARPVLNSSTGAEAAFIDSFPGRVAGNIYIDDRSQMASGELNGRYFLIQGNKLKVDALFGFRYAQLAESLSVQDQFAPLIDKTLTFNGADVAPGSTLSDMDRFRTTNNFYGLQFGGRFRWDQEWFFVSGYGKVAVGANEQNVNINGSSTLFTPTGATTTAGGILALPSNIGNYNRTQFGVIPEVGLNVGINVTKNLQLTAGYSFLYWNQVVRPGAQINRAVNPGLIPTDSSFGSSGGPSQPTFSFNTESFWIQSLTLGLCYKY